MESYSVLRVQVDVCFGVKCTEAELIKNTAVLRNAFLWLFFFLDQYHFFCCFLITY